MLLFVGYQLWGTGLQEASAQNSLGDDFDSLLDEVEIDFPTVTTTTVAPVETTAAPATTTTTTTTIPAAGGTIPVADQELAEALFREGGEAVARIEIPNIEVSKVVVEGVQVEDLRNGPGHYRATVFLAKRAIQASLAIAQRTAHPSTASTSSCQAPSSPSQLCRANTPTG